MTQKHESNLPPKPEEVRQNEQGIPVEKITRIMSANGLHVEKIEPVLDEMKRKKPGIYMVIVSDHASTGTEGNNFFVTPDSGSVLSVLSVHAFYGIILKPSLERLEE